MRRRDVPWNGQRSLEHHCGKNVKDGGESESECAPGGVSFARAYSG